ncbi:putative aldehyde dehydrogenase [Bisporella sp. PMI_857]|nr:putative aldehyde dehydrogenase [Bisporella sp. PMI_857]
MSNGGTNEVPLIIDSCDVFTPECAFPANNFAKPGYNFLVSSASIANCHKAVDSCSRAFEIWRYSSYIERRRLFLKLRCLLLERSEEARSLIQKEINGTLLWSEISVTSTLELIDEAAALLTSTSLDGVIPKTNSTSTEALIYTEPLGVILGIAPWNSPLILGFRAVVASIAAGNTAILKGSELSPRTHYFIARLFQDAGFPPGVLNFLIHNENDGPGVFQALIERREVRKCNFTGSTPIGRIIASQAALSLKPVLLELGGKNFALVTKDADLGQAAKLVIEGAFLNNGQIFANSVTPVITSKSDARIRALIDDAKSKGATITTNHSGVSKASGLEFIPATIIENLSPSMDFFGQESFGPLLGILPVSSNADAVRTINECPFGLSVAIFSQRHLEAMHLSKKLHVGAVHINGATVHDEATLPHGGYGDSGWGRFGGTWGLKEFVHTKTIMINE